MSAQPWGSDVPVSMPEPLKDQEGMIPMFGFTFTVNGLFHDLTEADHERLSIPTYAPISPANTVRDDLDLDEKYTRSTFSVNTPTSLVEEDMHIWGDDQEMEFDG